MGYHADMLYAIDIPVIEHNMSLRQAARGGARRVFWDAAGVPRRGLWRALHGAGFWAKRWFPMEI